MKRQVLCSVVLCLLAVAGISAQGPALLNGIRDTAACRKWVDRQMEGRAVVYLYSSAGRYSV